MPFTRERTDTTQLRDNAKKSREHARDHGPRLGCVAGFEVTALVEVELQDDEALAWRTPLSASHPPSSAIDLILVEGALEYGFVARAALWPRVGVGMTEKLAFRKTAEVVFIIN